MVNFHCIAEGCSNDSRKKHNALKYPDMILNGCIVDFHVLPSAIKNPKLRKLWLSQIRREGFNPDPNCHWHALCSRHFIEGRTTKENAVPTLFDYNIYKTGIPRDTKNSHLRPIEQLILTTQLANIVTVSQLPKVPRQKKYIPDIPVISYIEKPSLDHIYCLSTEVSEDVSIEEKCVLLIENNNTLEQKCQRYETDTNQLRKQVKLLQVELHATKEENKILNEKFNNTDKLLKDKLVEKLTKSDSNVKCFLRLASISMLFGIFKLLEGHASKMKYWMGPDSSDGKRWQVNNKK
ncbi:THAP1_3 [Mytilus coruscus]|uniref:THAP1_3 n=1 Tax=Mytilus coruscus TaxID=42192 RepID=A0A6J8AIV1_MYTCO|nr:THAP1_3 [Mytilus coruscus]